MSECAKPIECIILGSESYMFSYKLIIKKTNNNLESCIDIPKCYRYPYLKYLSSLRKRGFKIDEVITILTPHFTSFGVEYTFEHKEN